jgi:hypothetical protein
MMYGPYLRALSEFNAWGYAVMLPVLIWWASWLYDLPMMEGRKRRIEGTQ